MFRRATILAIGHDDHMIHDVRNDLGFESRSCKKNVIFLCLSARNLHMKSFWGLACRNASKAFKSSSQNTTTPSLMIFLATWHGNHVSKSEASKKKKGLEMVRDGSLTVRVFHLYQGFLTQDYTWKLTWH